MVMRCLSWHEKAARGDKNQSHALFANFDNLVKDAPRVGLLDIDNDEDDEAAQLPRNFQGYATEMDAAFFDCTPEERKVQIRICESGYSFYQLLEGLNSFSGTSVNTFKNPDRRDMMKRFLDENCTRYSSYTTPELQVLLQRKREHIWKEMMAGPLSHCWRGKRYLQAARLVVARQVSCYFEDCFDPQWGLWESLDQGRHRPDKDALSIMMDNPPAPLSVDAKRLGKSFIFEGPASISEFIEWSGKSGPLGEWESEKDFRSRISYKAKVNADKTSFSKECDRYRRVVEHARHNLPELCENKGRLQPVPFSTALRTTEPDVFKVICTDVQELMDRLSDEYDDACQKYGSPSAYFTEQFMQLKRTVEQTEEDYNNKKWPTDLMAAVNFVADPNFTTYKAENLGCRGVKTKCAIDIQLNNLQRKFYEDAGCGYAEKKAFDMRLQNDGFFVMRDQGADQAYQCLSRFGGYVMGHEMNKYEDKKDTLHMPKTNEDVVPLGDLSSILDLYDGRFGEIFDDEKQEYFLILKDPDAWLPWIEVAIAHFEFATIDEQIAILEDFMYENPRLQEIHLRRAPVKVRQRLCRMFLDRCKLDEATVDRFIEFFAPKEQSTGMCGEDYEDAAAAAKTKKGQAEALKEKTRDRHTNEVREGATVGITRERAQKAVYWFNKHTNEYLGCARSHRCGQGKMPDKMRLHWKTHTYRPSKTFYAPSCHTTGNMEENVRLILLPKLCRECGLSPDDVLSIRHDQKVSDFDELLFDVPGQRPQPPPKPAMKRGPPADKAPPTPAKKPKKDG